MGNCCCFHEDREKRFGAANKRLKKGRRACHTGVNGKKYYKYAAAANEVVDRQNIGIEEGLAGGGDIDIDIDEDDEPNTTFDHDLQTTRSSISTAQLNKHNAYYDKRMAAATAASSTVASSNKNKVLLKNHSHLIAQKQQQLQQQQQFQHKDAGIVANSLSINQKKLSVSSATNQLYLQQSHLTDLAASGKKMTTTTQSGQSQQQSATATGRVDRKTGLVNDENEPPVKRSINNKGFYFLNFILFFFLKIQMKSE